MFSSVVCYIPLLVALTLHLLVDFAAFLNVGFVIALALLRLLFVVEFDRVLACNPQSTTKGLSSFMITVYLMNTAKAFVWVHLSFGRLHHRNTGNPGNEPILKCTQHAYGDSLGNSALILVLHPALTQNTPQPSNHRGRNRSITQAQYVHHKRPGCGIYTVYLHGCTTGSLSEYKTEFSYWRFSIFIGLGWSSV